MFREQRTIREREREMWTLVQRANSVILLAHQVAAHAQHLEDQVARNMAEAHTRSADSFAGFKRGLAIAQVDAAEPLAPLRDHQAQLRTLCEKAEDRLGPTWVTKREEP
jgi:hypothetical protein